MATWATFEAAAPGLAAAGRRLLYQGGEVAGAFLATVRADGGPRVHPIFPVIAYGGLHAFIVDPGWKYRDLLRDGRYALHCFPPPAGGEEFYLDGRARPLEDPGVCAAVAAATGGRQGGAAFERLFALEIERVLHTTWTGWGTEQAWPTFKKWRDPAA
jgi:hypothetical protein